MTKTLTEQWREGDMEGGIYYCKTKSYGEKKLWFHHRVYGGMYVQTYGTEEMFPEEDIVEVLAPVPSYDEYKRLEKKLEIATKALKDIVKDYDINGSCEEDCVGEYMCHTAIEALKEMEGVKMKDRWKFCQCCYLNGHCENQDRDMKCETYPKQLEDKVERLQEQLKEAVDFIEELSEACDLEGILYPEHRKKLEEIEKWDVE